MLESDVPVVEGTSYALCRKLSSRQTRQQTSGSCAVARTPVFQMGSPPTSRHHNVQESTPGTIFCSNRVVREHATEVVFVCDQKRALDEESFRCESSLGTRSP